MLFHDHLLSEQNCRACTITLFLFIMTDQSSTGFCLERLPYSGHTGYDMPGADVYPRRHPKEHAWMSRRDSRRPTSDDIPIGKDGEH